MMVAVSRRRRRSAAELKLDFGCGDVVHLEGQRGNLAGGDGEGNDNGEDEDEHDDDRRRQLECGLHKGWNAPGADFALGLAVSTFLNKGGVLVKHARVVDLFDRRSGAGAFSPLFVG